MSEHAAEIAEAEAQGEIAELYTDIRRRMGIGMVNLIYRRMAARPGVLPWAWAALRPLFTGGGVAEAAAELRAGLDDGGLEAVSREAFFAAGLNDHSLRTVRMILDDYNRGNLANLLAIGALAAFLDGGGPARPPRPADESAAEARPPRLPPIRKPDALDESTAELVRQLAAPVAPEGSPMIPSLYLHLAPWPAWLAMAAATALTPSRLAAARGEGRELYARAQPSIAALAADMAPAAGIEAPAASELAALAKTARTFAEGPIASMVVLGNRMRSILPEIPPHRH